MPVGGTRRPAPPRFWDPLGEVPKGCLTLGEVPKGCLGGRVSSLTGVKGGWAGPLSCPACCVCVEGLGHHTCAGFPPGVGQGAQDHRGGGLTCNPKGQVRWR